MCSNLCQKPKTMLLYDIPVKYKTLEVLFGTVSWNAQKSMPGLSLSEKQTHNIFFLAKIYWFDQAAKNCVQNFDAFFHESLWEI